LTPINFIFCSMYNKLFFFVVFILITIQSFAQTWQITSESEIENKGRIDISPKEFALFSMDDTIMQALLWRAPHERDLGVHESDCVIMAGLPEGTTERFQVVQYDMMEPGLAAKYPEIRTFYGVSLVNPMKRIRIDYTIEGFRAVITAPGEDKIFIDHYQRNDKNTRISYYKQSYSGEHWGCNVESDHDHEILDEQNHNLRVGDCQLRSYRLAQATTGEYSNFHGATSSAQSNLVLSAVVTVINRVNEVYEPEVAVRMILIANTDLVFYYDSVTDGYTNDGSSSDLTANQTNCTNVIGSANYDIGHVFGTGDGGIAGLGVVCSSSNKARGYTGRPNPVGDAFTIDYVTHEMGHQFNANHTQFNSCNRNNTTAMEPGSASSIMGYAGICAPDVQNNSDAYFHAISMQEIKTYLSGTGNSCALIVSSFSNSAPVVTSQPNYTIPASTPFVLTLAATDPNGNPMTYAWDQMDYYSVSQTMPPASTNTSGPAFRSVFATTSPSRYFPPLTNVINNTTDTWQVLPSVARTMSFRGVARDYTGVAGCNSEINLTVTTVASGAFTVTSQNTAATWYEGQNQTITWNVGGTTASPISCSQVSILLSYDGGYTYPVTLSASTANDGSESIVVPEGLSSTARIMVKAIGNVFFGINNANITILSGVPTFFMTVDPTSVGICSGGSGNVNINIERILGFANPINLSVTSIPAGINYSFSNNPVNQGQNSVLSLTHAGAAEGSYTVSIKAISGSIVRIADVSLEVLGSTTQTTLVYPADQQTGISIFPLLEWAPVAAATGYELVVSRDEDFNTLILETTPETSTFQIVDALEGASEFFWKVRPVNVCSIGSWSEINSFETQACFVYKSLDVPKTISASGTQDVSSYHTVLDRGVITDLDVLNLEGLHTYVSDLRFTLYSPNATNVRIWNTPCGNYDNFDINFDQSAPAGSWPCPPTDGGTYRPSNTLNTFNTRQIKGQWRMRVQDLANQDGGSLQKWEIKTCVTNFCRLTVDNSYQNGAGSIYSALQCASTGDTIRFNSALENEIIDLGDQNLILDKQLVIEGDLSKNIHLYSNSNDALIVNSAPSSGAGLLIKGLHLHRLNNNDSMIENNGKLILQDVILHHSAGNTHEAIFNTSASSLEVRGNCEVLHE